MTYYCDQCDKTTKSSGGLARHKKIHEQKQASESEEEGEGKVQAVEENEPEVIELNTTTEDESSLEIIEEIPPSNTIQPSVQSLSKLMDDWMDWNLM